MNMADDVTPEDEKVVDCVCGELVLGNDRRAAKVVANYRLASAESLRAAIAPVLHWYQSDEHPARDLADILTDIVADLQADRETALKVRKAEAELAEAKADIARLADALAACWALLQCDPNYEGSECKEIARQALAKLSEPRS